MAVYVDDAKNPYRGMLMSHMIADTLDELHVMAHAIGLEQRWFQNTGNHPHYDVSQSKRDLAIQKGAKAVSQTELVMINRKIRGKINEKQKKE